MLPISERFFIIAGPTAVGKSALAVEVAERCQGEIVNADAFQIYQGLDILTAKPAADLLARVPHHLVGTVPLSQSFDVAQFLAAARECIAEIHHRQRLPIVVGGTGLYLRALTHGLADLPPADSALRAELESRSPEALEQQLATLDPVAFSQIDLKNPRRVIRALEVYLLTGRPFSSFREQWEKPAPQAQGVVLTRPREELVERIDRRTETMFAAGVIEEVANSPEPGLTAGQTLGWREIRDLLDGRISREACIAAIQQSTRRYAKRQMTWFRRETAWPMIDLSTAESSSLLSQLATQTLGLSGRAAE